MSPSEAHDEFLRYAAAWFKVDVTDVMDWLSKKDQPVYAVLGNMQTMFVVGWDCGRRAALSEG